MKKFVCVLAVALLLCGGFAYQFYWGKPLSFNLFVERVSLRKALSDPELLSSLGLFENGIFDFHSDKLTDISFRKNLESLALVQDSLRVLHEYDPEGLAPQEKLTYDILEKYLQTGLEEASFEYGSPMVIDSTPYPVNQLFGIQNSLPSFMVDVHRVVNKKSAQNYIARLSQWDKKFTALIQELKLRESKGVVPPLFVIQKVVAEVREFIGVSPEENVLASSFQDKIEKIHLSKEDRIQLERKAIREIRETVYPAYERLIAFLEEQKKIATQEAGVWKLPKGDAYYAFCLKYHTTTDYSPEFIHKLGLSEVARIQKEMKQIVAELGFPDQDPMEFMRALNTDPRFFYPNTEEGRSQILADYRAILADVEGRLKPLFAHFPSAELRIEAVPDFKARSAPIAYYEPGDLKGIRPGIFFANTQDMKNCPKFTMAALAYHEGVPGHHFQISIAQEMKNLPVFRTIVPFTAYQEGWALYCEQLAWEYGFIQDPYSNLGRLQMELMRAVRLVVDTGIHYKKWSREEAIQYMAANTGKNENDVVIEIERYIVLPGQACSYKVGMIKILELREKMKQRLGEAFDIRQFHDFILQDGAMPLDLMEKRLDHILKKQE